MFRLQPPLLGGHNPTNQPYIIFTLCLHIFTTKLAFSTSSTSVDSLAASSLQSAYVAMAGKRRVSTNHSHLLIKASASFKMISLHMFALFLPHKSNLACYASRRQDISDVSLTKSNHSMHMNSPNSCNVVLLWPSLANLSSLHRAQSVELRLGAAVFLFRELFSKSRADHESPHAQRPAIFCNHSRRAPWGAQFFPSYRPFTTHTPCNRCLDWK